METFIEAVGGEGKAFRVRIIKDGLSGNGVFYPAQVLREAAPLFEGARVFAKSDREHLQGAGKDIRHLIGKLTDVTFVEASQAGSAGELQATLHVLQSVDGWSGCFTEAISRGMADLYALSIDALGRGKQRMLHGKPVRFAESITAVKSVDLIVEAGAGGGLIRLVEARDETAFAQENAVLRTDVIAMIEAKAPQLLDGKDRDGLSDDDLSALFREALKSETKTNPVPAQTPAQTFNPDLLAAEVDARLSERLYLREAVGASTLPQAAKDKVLSSMQGRPSLSKAEVDAAIAAEREYLARFTESGRVTGLGATASVQWGESRDEKVSSMLDAFFDPKHKDHKHARSFKTCYREATGDSNITGMTRDCDQVVLREALGSSSWAEVLGDAITRRLIADYRDSGAYDVWRRMATLAAPSDFRVQERTRIGGYGALPTVAEGADYAALTSPGDEMASYAVGKRGGLETVTLEMIANDDVSAIRQIPVKLSRAAKRTLGRFVLDAVRTNAPIYDGKALAHVDHGNLGTSALASASLAAGRLAMLKQSEAGSNEPLAIGPSTLWVPPDLQEAATDLFRRNTENDKTFLQDLSLDVVPVWYWTDPNDWAMTADPFDIPLIEVGFLNGEEEPALFVQDNPSVGSLFAADKVTYKIRHIYGATVLDYRGFYLSRVP